MMFFEILDRLKPERWHKIYPNFYLYKNTQDKKYKAEMQWVG